MSNTPPPYSDITGISRAVMKDNKTESLANYNGNARPGELVVNLESSPPALYVGDNLGQLNAIGGSSSPATPTTSGSIYGYTDASYYNTYVGYCSGNTIGTGSNNIAQGYKSLSSNTDGSNNIAQGYYTLRQNTSGNFNTAFGFRSLTNNTIGNNNIGIGYSSLFYNTTGNDNIAIGYSALQCNTTGYNNIAEGYQSLFYNTTGCNNIAQGYRALSGNTTGSNNIAIGICSGATVQSDNSIILNATGSTLNSPANNTFTVKPVRGDSTANLVGGGFKAVYYNPTTGEFAYTTD